MRSYCIFYSDEISIVTIKYLMLIEIDSLDLIAEFCVYIYILQWKNSQVHSCLMIRFLPHYFENQNMFIHMNTVCYVIMQFSVFHSFGPVFCLVKLCR